MKINICNFHVLHERNNKTYKSFPDFLFKQLRNKRRISLKNYLIQVLNRQNNKFHYSEIIKSGVKRRT